MPTSVSCKSPSFNLVDEPWIPVAAHGLASLRDIFSDGKLSDISGTPIQKIALSKLLQAVAQAALTPENDEEWLQTGKDGLAKAALAYLDQWHDRFYLRGPEPFLQMPLAKAKAFPYGIAQPEIAMGNNPRLMHMQCEQPLSDAEKARLLITLSSMCLGGKGQRGDNSFSFSKSLVKKSAPPGPGMGFMGFLHSFLTGASIIETIWLNLFTKADIDALSNLPGGLGTPPWERMPETEECEVAEDLKSSLMGRLVPLARFCFLEKDGLRFTQGITHDSYKEGLWDPSVSANGGGKTLKMLWADPGKRPWRSLASRLSFLQNIGNKTGFECFQIKQCLPRAKSAQLKSIGIWSGGLRVSSNAGEQYVSGDDDVIQSEIRLDPAVLGKNWHLELTAQMDWLDQLSRVIYACVMGYYRKLTRDEAGGKKGGGESDHLAKTACAYFWEKGEKLFPALLAACDRPELLRDARKKYFNLVRDAYNIACPAATARQMAAWAENLPGASLEKKKEHPQQSSLMDAFVGDDMS